MSGLGWLLLVDGAAFVVIGLVVLAAPSPQPALSRILDAEVLVPFLDTRRLLASQFLGVGLLALVIATQVHDAATLRVVALARVLTLLVVIAINAYQLRDGAWKRGPLHGLLTGFVLLATCYLGLAVIS